jgi:putative sigma-54 modulation protein
MESRLVKIRDVVYIARKKAKLGVTMKDKIKAQELDQKYNVIVTGRHVHVTDAMKSYAVDKVSKLERIGTRIIDVSITMDIQKLNHRCDIIMKYGNTNIKSTGISTDMYVSVDMAVDHLQAQLKRYLTRLHDYHAKNHAIVEVPERIWKVAELDLSSSDVDDLNDAIERETARRLKEEFQPHHIVRTETQPLRILTEDEAIMKMELLGLPLMVFRAEETKKLKVIYRRDDGHYGVISPEE